MNQIKFVEKEQYDFEVVEDSKSTGFDFLQIPAILIAVILSPFMLIGILSTHNKKES